METSNDKAAIIEASLALQRELLSNEQVVNCQQSKQMQSIAGLRYDEERDRYFKMDSVENRRLLDICMEGESTLKIAIHNILKSFLLGQLGNNKRDWDRHISTSNAKSLSLRSASKEYHEDLAYHHTHGLARCTPKHVQICSSYDVFNDKCITIPLNAVLSPAQSARQICWKPCSNRLLAISAASNGSPDTAIVLKLSDADHSVKFSQKYSLQRDNLRSLHWHGDNLLIGCDTSLSAFSLDTRVTTKPRTVISNVDSPVVAIATLPANHDGNCVIVGQRNGFVQMIDSRCRSNQPKRKIAASRHCVDHITVLPDNVSTIIQDVTGQVSIYDVRYSSREYLRVTESSASVRTRRFWVSADSKSMVLSHPSIADEGLGVFSLVHANTLLGVSAYPWTPLSSRDARSLASPSSISGGAYGLHRSNEHRFSEYEAASTTRGTASQPWVKLATVAATADFEHARDEDIWCGLHGIAHNIPRHDSSHSRCLISSSLRSTTR